MAYSRSSNRWTKFGLNFALIEQSPCAPSHQVTISSRSPCFFLKPLMLRRFNPSTAAPGKDRIVSTTWLPPPTNIQGWSPVQRLPIYQEDWIRRERNLPRRSPPHPFDPNRVPIKVSFLDSNIHQWTHYDTKILKNRLISRLLALIWYTLEQAPEYAPSPQQPRKVNISISNIFVKQDWLKPSSTPMTRAPWSGWSRLPVHALICRPI